MTREKGSVPLKLTPYNHYAGMDRDDPLRFYYWPIIGSLYRRRVELCLSQCRGGKRLLEIGFGSGVTFLNLREKYQEIHGLDLKAPAGQVRDAFTRMEIETHLLTGNVMSLPYANGSFDAVLMISILEHLESAHQADIFSEVQRVLRPGGQAIYGVPVERPFMSMMFRLLGYNIHEHHYSSEQQVFRAASTVLNHVELVRMRGPLGLFGTVYEVGHFMKQLGTGGP